MYLHHNGFLVPSLHRFFRVIFKTDLVGCNASVTYEYRAMVSSLRPIGCSHQISSCFFIVVYFHVTILSLLVFYVASGDNLDGSVLTRMSYFKLYVSKKGVS